MLHFAMQLTLISETRRGGRIRVNIRGDRPFVYLSTATMGLLYQPLIPEENISSKVEGQSNASSIR